MSVVLISPPATRDVRLSISVRSKPERIYRALTSARELTQWWLLGAETDAKNGGRVRMIWPRLRGADRFGEREGIFVDLEPGRKVAWLWKLKKKEKIQPLTSIFILPARLGSEVTLVHAGFPSGADAVYDMYARVWEDGLAKLKLYAETGRTCKSEMLDLEAARILLKAKK